MSPLHFLQRPARWLEAVARERASVSGAPNFAYELCLRKLDPEQRQALDLSRWTLAFNGAEPVRAATLERFAAGFAASGFRAAAFRPCYGLAESTLLVSAGAAGTDWSAADFDAAALEHDEARPAGPGAARRLVGCGQAAHGQRVVVVDPATQAACEPGCVGEIWVQGASVAQGYFDRPDESARTFAARLADGDGPFLRTGDLGFLRDGELYVTGRLKDLIVVRGRNLYPQDLEASAERAHTGLRPGGAAAFALDADGQEQLALVLEVDRPQRGFDAARILADVRAALVEAHDAPPAAVALVAPGELPKTSSGKIQRRAARALFESGRLSTLAVWRAGVDDAAAAEADDAGSDAPALTETERALAGSVAAHLGLDPRRIALDAPLSRLGLDSLAAVELTHAIERDLGRAPAADALLRLPNLRALAAELDETTASDVGAGGSGDGPLSAGQRALWFLHQLAPQSPARNVARAARLRGNLDVAALRRAFALLHARHAVLRTTYVETPAGPWRRVAPTADPALTLANAHGWSDAALDARLRDESERPFDLGQGPVLRVTLLRRADDEHLLLLCAHHIAVDFWSLAVLWDELRAAYAAEIEGRPATLPTPEADYGDYVAWQEQRLAGESGQRLLEGWRRRLDRAPALELPLDRPRPRTRTQAGATVPLALDADLTRALRALAESRGVTLFVLLLAAFQALLQRLTGQDDFVIGSPSAGRARAGFAGVVGYFANPLPLRADLAGDPRFDELVERTRGVVLEARAGEDCPLPWLVERLQPAREAGRSPLFDVAFALQKAPRAGAGALAPLALGQAGAALDFAGLALEPLPLPQPGAQFDLTLSLAECGDVLSGACEYASDVLDRESARLLAERFETLLRGVAADPAQRLSELPLLGPTERARLESWSVASTPYPRKACVHELFAEQAARAPEAVALISDAGEVTYAGLQRHADRLARALHAAGVAPGERVGLLLGRSAEYVAAVLAVLQRGAAYVPLDPTYPQERLAYVAGDAGARVVVTSRAHLERLPAGALPLLVDDLAGDELGAPLPPVRVPPEAVAYVMYTSGSTGRPKGVAVPHRGVVRLVREVNWASFGPRDTFLLFAPISFDASTFELWGALLSGARLTLFPGGAAALPELPEALRRFGVTTLLLTSGPFHQLVDAHAGQLGGLRRLLAGGDVLSPAHVRRALERHPSLEVVNVYGPTENTTFSTVQVLRDPAQVGAGVPIGTTVANSSAHVLDPHGRRSPVGAAGELYVGGDGLALGYLGRPELTAERFVPDPFGPPGARLYRTGDRVRLRHDGALEFLGRLDRQVKVRGVRIEPGEVEAALAEHPGVRAGVVLAVGEGAEERRLVAWVVPQPGQAPDAAELRAFLETRLPALLVPSAVVFVDALPLTPNGKLDREALPRPEADRAATPYEAPRDEVEAELAALWCEVLGLERVGVHDGFFELGGHSLLATQLVTRVRRSFRVDFPLSSLFERPSVAGLAAVLRTHEQVPGRTRKVARALQRLRHLSPEEARALLAQRQDREVSL
jgi:amino acid adenylation domain-containing protein